MYNTIKLISTISATPQPYVPQFSKLNQTDAKIEFSDPKNIWVYPRIEFHGILIVTPYLVPQVVSQDQTDIKKELNDAKNHKWYPESLFEIFPFHPHPCTSPPPGISIFKIKSKWCQHQIQMPILYFKEFRLLTPSTTIFNWGSNWHQYWILWPPIPKIWYLGSMFGIYILCSKRYTMKALSQVIEITIWLSMVSEGWCKETEIFSGMDCYGSGETVTWKIYTQTFLKTCKREKM